MCYEIEFRDFDGSLVNCLAAITGWIIKHNPTNPKIMVMEQSSILVKINIVCDDYEN